MSCGRGEGDEALKLGSNPGLCSWDSLVWYPWDRDKRAAKDHSFLFLWLQRKANPWNVSSEQGENKRFTTFLSPLTIWIFFFFLSFSPWGLEEVGYFILIMAAAAAACEPKDQFSDQKEKHIHIPTDKLTQSINYIREGQLLQRAHRRGCAWRNLGRHAQRHSDPGRDPWRRFPAASLPPGFLSAPSIHTQPMSHRAA